MSDKNDFDLSEFDNFSYDDGFGDTANDDDIGETFEDDAFEADELSDEEYVRRLEQHEKKVAQYSRMALKAKQFNKQQRVEAVRWLGESGELKAIPPLVKVYRKDKTPGMKEEAAYALGQFKALERDFNDPEMQETALQRIEAIAVHDKLGKRASALPFILGEVALVVLAIILFAIGSVLAAGNASERAEFRSQTQTAMPTPTPDTEDALVSDIQTYYQALVSDSNFYQEQLAAAGRGEGITCPDSLNNPQPYAISSTWADNADYATSVDTLNSIQATLQNVVVPYDTACANGVAMSREQALDLGSTIIEVQRSLRDARETLTATGITIEEQAFATTTPEPEPTSDPANPPPTQDLTVYNDDIVRIEFIIDDMLAQLGTASQNVFNWQQVIDNNAIYRSGCNQPNPIIPDDFSLSPGLAGTNAILDSAVTNLNTGLQSTRLSVEAFYAACDAGTVPEDAGGRAAQAQLGLAAFEAAQSDINAFRGR